MKNALRMLLIIALALAPACGGDAANRVVGDATVFVNGARLSIESAETAAVLAYKEQQKLAVVAIANSGGTREMAEREVASIRAQWEPIWDAFRIARAAHATLRTALDGYERNQAVLIGAERRVPTLADIARLSADLAAAHEKLTELLRRGREATWANK
jgi:hypothetical protein